MQQLDLFSKNTDDFLYSEIQKVRNSLDKRSKALFALLSEIQDQLLEIKKNEGKKIL